MIAPSIVALDLSLAASGHFGPEGGGTIPTAPGQPVECRLIHIRDEVLDLLPVDLVVIEDFVTRSPAASVLGMVHGIVRVALVERDQAFVLVPPALLKKYATGKGNAKKEDIRLEVYKRWALDIPDDNERDAFVLRAMAFDAYGHPVASVPATHRVALEKVAWPELDREVVAP